VSQLIQNSLDAITGDIAIFSHLDWEELNCIIVDILTNHTEIFESPKQGDSRNEQVDLCVARFIVRKNECSSIVNNTYSSKILSLLDRANFIPLVSQKTKLQNLKILRMQLNCMKKNSFVGAHTDTEHDKAYKVTAIIRTVSSHSGGELYLYGEYPQIINQKNNSIFLMDPKIVHEVKIVTEGYRNSLVVVLG
jgi:Rps23 Pro-64 3,4-dihydroxylase Tpa1-like proline 4-hydroxylase